MDDKPTVVTIPTELERQDAFFDIGILATAGILAWYAHDTLRVDVWWLAPLLVVVALECLTGEPAADVGFVGSIAAGLRNKFGLRRAHEWVLAFAWFYRTAIWPVWRAWCLQRLSFAHRRMILWRLLTSEQTKWWLSVACSWAWRIRPSLSRRREN